MRLLLPITLSLMSLLGGCGTMTPHMKLFTSDRTDPYAEAASEIDLIGYVKCVLHASVAEQIANSDRAKDGHGPGEVPLDWLRDWGAQISMVLAVDEKSTLAPGLSFTSPIANAISTFSTGGSVVSGQSFALGLGASVSSEAIRDKTVSFYYAFADLLTEGKDADWGKRCGTNESGIFDGDLGVRSFFVETGRLASNPKLLLRKAGVPATASPFLTLTHHVKFIVVSSGSVTPTWKLLRVTGNPSGPFASAIRTRTDDITITLGASTTAENGAKAPSTDAHDQFFANLIGQAVAAAIRNQ